MNRQIYVNLPVKNLKNTMSFFSNLGFEFNSQFTNDDAACLVIGENIFAMLLTETFFKSFLTTTSLIDAKKHTEVLVCINAESRDKVDEMVKKAVAAGGNAYRDPMDHGFMYAQAFQDLDGHIWEIMWMDPKAMQK